jgi:trimethylamine--corrinoid protein Co-methyltransferase
MLMDCEIFGIVRKMMDGIVVNDDTLALDAIRAVGPGGNFLAQKHTRTHMREVWLPTLMDRRAYDVWEETGGGARHWARDRAKKILGTHQPAPLAPEIGREFERIIAAIEDK